MSISSWISENVTDPLGITDSQASKRAADAAAQGIGAAGTAYDEQTNQAIQRTGLDRAATEHQLDDNLDNYNLNYANRAKSLLNNASGAGSADRVQDYLNPNAQRMMDNAAQQMAGRSGASLQSSAANKAMASAVADKSAEQWNTAFQQSLADSQNDQGVASGIGNLGQSVLDNNNQPGLDFLNAAFNSAAQKYQGAMDVTQANVETAGQNQSVLGQIFG